MVDLPLPFAPTGWKTMWLDHLSYRCTDYKRTYAFYDALLGWKQSGPFNGTQVNVVVTMGAGTLARW